MQRTRKCMTLKLISFVLSLLMLFYAIPAIVYAETIDALSSLGGGEEDIGSVDTNSDFEAPIYEVKSLREETVKHFRLSDGSYVAAQYLYPVHYEDENGIMQEINNALYEGAGGVYTNENARIKFAKKITGNEEIFSLHDKNTKITLALSGAKKGTVGVVKNSEEDGEGDELQKMMFVKDVASGIVYSDILHGVDVEYVVYSNNVKENIIVKEKSDTYSYSFELKLNGLTAALLENGNVEIRNEKSGKTEYVIPSPVVYDANSKYAAEESAYYTLEEKNQSGAYLLTVTVSSDWMNDTERAFPVVVDPAVVSSYSDVLDTTVYSSDPSNTHGGLAKLDIITDDAHAYWKVTTLPTLPASAYITNANISAKSQSSDGEYIALYEVTNNWDESLTWNQHTSTSSPKGKLGSKVIDYNVDTDGIYTWNVSALIDKWYSGTNYGVALKTPPGMSSSVSIFSSEFALHSFSPYLTVNYVDMKGVEPYLPYATHSAGVAGSGSVNLATGQLTLTVPTLSTTDSLMPYTLALVYNSSLSAKDYVSGNAETANEVSYMPYGFKLNLCETIVSREYVDNSGETQSYYIYADADGTEHAFFPSTYNEDIYVDQSGLQKRLTITGVFFAQIIDDTGITRLFELCGDGPSWRLVKITDISGNTINFTYNSSDRPTQISITPNGSDEIDFLDLYYYSSGKLRMVYNPTTKDAVVFRYSSSYNDAISTTSQNYLRQIDYAHGNSSVTLANWQSFSESETNKTNITVDASANYEYRSSGYMTYAIDNLADQEMRYSWVSKKLSELNPFAGTSPGQFEGYSYEVGYTDVKRTGNDEILHTTDDLYIRHVFDRNGRSKSVYSYSRYGTEIYSAVSGEYESQENVKNNLKERTDFGGSSVNYLLNGDFEDTTSETSFSHWTLSGSVTRKYRSGTFDGEGDYSLLFKPTSGASASITQYVSLKAGQYTLSMPYLTQFSNGITGLVSITSTAGSGFTHTAEIPLNKNTTNGEQTVFSTSFSVASYTNGGDNLKITIKFTAASSVTSAPTIEIDRVMLENNLGASSFSLVSYGSFDANGLNAAGTATSLVNYWKSESLSAPVTASSGSNFGATAKITGQISAERYIKQRIYQISNESLEYYEANGSSAYSNANSEYIISGFARAQNASPSPHAVFRIRVDVIYYQRGTAQEVKVSHYFDFLPSCTDWQFTGGSFSTKNVPEPISGKDYSCVKAIDLYCEYSYQPTGYANFDNISVVNSTGTDIEKYTYYSSGTSDGLLQSKENLFYIEYYEYDEKRNLSRVANNRGELIDYEYDSQDRVIKITNCEFTYNGHTDYPLLLDDPDSEITKNPKTRTEYTYNDYGLITGEETYKINANFNRVNSEPSFSVSYSYNVEDESKIFGSLNTETDSLGNVTQYYYDDTNGRLLAVLNPEEENGLCYGYNSKGNLISVMPAKYETSTSYTPITNKESVSYTYNADNLLDTISTKFTEYSFIYDEFGNPESVMAGDNILASYEYNQYNGKLTSVNYSNGFSVEYVYNDIEFLKEVWYNYSDGTRELVYGYEYTAYGQVYKFTDNTNEKSIVYRYDNNHRLVGFAEYKNDELYHDFSAEVYYNDKGELSNVYYTLNDLSGTALIAGEYFYSYNDNGTLSSTGIDTAKTLGDEEYSYDIYNRINSKTTSHRRKDNSSAIFESQVTLTYTESGSKTSSWIKDYVSTVNGATVTYTHTYDDNGNITKVEYSTGEEVRYVYDEIGSLVREDNELLNKTYVYTYDSGGNITTKKTYALASPDANLPNPVSTRIYGYSTSNWGDVLDYCSSVYMTYDDMGNPLSYYNGSSYSFAWTGRQLTTATKGGNTYNYTYNDEGIRTSKTTNGVTTNYYLNGSQIIAEETNGNITVYIYDASGTPIGMQYRGASYASGVWDIYWYEKNLFGDIVAVYDHSGTKRVSYIYDAWGNFTTAYHNGTTSSSQVAKNPFRYRGYYYDQDLALYYLQTRYYDSNTGRFINADSVDYLGANRDINSYNLFAYCSNNPVMNIDPTGHSIIFCFLVATVLTCTTIGGISAYNTAKENGATGFELFKKTLQGIGKGSVVGLIAGGLIVTTGFAIALSPSKLGTALSTVTISSTGKFLEVLTLQYRYSRNDREGGWELANDCINSLFYNGGKILFPFLSKFGTTTIGFLSQIKASQYSPKKYLNSPPNGNMSYSFAIGEIGEWLEAIFCPDPLAQARERGYKLQ